MGRNKVMAVGLGRTPEAEIKPSLHKLSAGLIGSRGLLFTNESVESVKGWLVETKTS